MSQVTLRVASEFSGSLVNSMVELDHSGDVVGLTATGQVELSNVIDDHVKEVLAELSAKIDLSAVDMLKEAHVMMRLAREVGEFDNNEHVMAKAGKSG